MCGICGVVGKADEPLLKNMLAAIAHRGPDDEGIYLADNAPGSRVGLGHRRLAIIDLSPAGHEPMSDADGEIWLTFNGEIYNFKEIRVELIKRGVQFKSESDAEVIIYAYREWGLNALTLFNGIFAFAIWDARTKELLLARDRLGIKPLYYAETPAGFAFASEIKAILTIPGARREVDLEALHQYLSFLWTPDPKTIFQGIQKLPPGHFLIYKDGHTDVRQYWDLEFNEDETLS